jgi:hypothetical protein
MNESFIVNGQDKDYLKTLVPKCYKSIFVDSRKMQSNLKFQVNIFILYIFSLPLNTPETLAF